MVEALPGVWVLCFLPHSFWLQLRLFHVKPLFWISYREGGSRSLCCSSLRCNPSSDVLFLMTGVSLWWWWMVQWDHCFLRELEDPNSCCRQDTHHDCLMMIIALVFLRWQSSSSSSSALPCGVLQQQPFQQIFQPTISNPFLFCHHHNLHSFFPFFQTSNQMGWAMFVLFFKSLSWSELHFLFSVVFEAVEIQSTSFYQEAWDCSAEKKIVHHLHKIFRAKLVLMWLQFYMNSVCLSVSLIIVV